MTPPVLWAPDHRSLTGTQLTLDGRLASGRGARNRVTWALFKDFRGSSSVTGFCTRTSLAEFCVGVGAQATPPRRPHLVYVAEVRECASRPFGGILAPPCLVHGQTFERAERARVALSCVWMQLLKLRKATSHDYGYYGLNKFEHKRPLSVITFGKMVSFPVIRL